MFLIPCSVIGIPAVLVPLAVAARGAEVLAVVFAAYYGLAVWLLFVAWRIHLRFRGAYRSAARRWGGGGFQPESWSQYDG